MKKRTILVIIIVVLFVIVFFGVLMYNRSANAANVVYTRTTFASTIPPTNTITNDTIKIEYPIVEDTKNSDIIKRTYYTLSYNEKHEQPNWVMYLLTKKHITGSQLRDDKFKEDPRVYTKSAIPADYKNSGYDRGHLCPAADMRIDDVAMKETFFLSNISPQLHSFNAGVWLDLENDIRDFTLKHDSLWVVTGPVLNDSLTKYIGSVNKITVPDYFYKVVYCKESNKMIGFLVPHIKTKNKAKTYVCPVDSIEKLTKMNFFNGVPNEDSLECIKSDYSWWIK